MANIVGLGERRHPPNGNAVLTTIGGNGTFVQNWLWLSSFATDLNLQLDTAQLHHKVTHRPIRLTERMLTFSALWNVRRRQSYIQLIDNLRQHWQFNLDQQDIVFPMTLRYFGANKTWQGFVENASIGYAVTDVVLAYQFRMRLLANSSEFVANALTESRTPFAPGAIDVSYRGQDWYSVDERTQIENTFLSGARVGRQ